MGTTLDLPADPWQWPTLSNEELLLLSDRSPIEAGPTAPLFKYAAVRNVNGYRAAIEKGDGFAVLTCVRICGTHGLVMPEWLVFAFNRRYDAVNQAHAKSWDDPKAFGKPYRPIVRLAALRKRLLGASQMWSAVSNEVKKGRRGFTPSDFEEIGAQFNLGKTLADKYYRIGVRMMGSDPIAHRAAVRKAERGKAQKLPAKTPKIAGRSKRKP